MSRTDSAVPLQTVLVTDELNQRPSRPADYGAENRALAELARELADSPQNILPKLCELARTLCRAGSAGISL